MYSDTLRRSRSTTAVVAVFAAILAVFAALQLTQVNQAQANTLSPDAVHGFCENVQLGGNGYCAGPTTGMYQTYGWGDQHSVCVDIRPWSGVRRCSSGPGAGVYSGEIPPSEIGENTGTAWIENNAAGANYVHGVWLTR